MNPYLTVEKTSNAPTPVQSCLACAAPVRRARVVTEITVMLDAAPTKRGSYYFADDRGLITEDVAAYTGDPTYRRHRCTTKVMRGWNGTHEH